MKVKVSERSEDYIIHMLERLSDSLEGVRVALSRENVSIARDALYQVFRQIDVEKALVSDDPLGEILGLMEGEEFLNRYMNTR